MEGVTQSAPERSAQFKRLTVMWFILNFFTIFSGELQLRVAVSWHAAGQHHVTDLGYTCLPVAVVSLLGSACSLLLAEQRLQQAARVDSLGCVAWFVRDVALAVAWLPSLLDLQRWPSRATCLAYLRGNTTK